MAINWLTEAEWKLYKDLYEESIRFLENFKFKSYEDSDIKKINNSEFFKSDEDIKIFIRDFRLNINNIILNEKYYPKPVTKFDWNNIDRYRGLNVPKEDQGRAYRNGQERLKGFNETTRSVYYKTTKITPRKDKRALKAKELRTLLNDYIFLIVVLRNWGCHPSFIYRFLCKYLEKLSLYKEETVTFFIEENIIGYLSLYPSYLLDILKNTNTILDNSKITFNITEKYLKNGSYNCGLTNSLDACNQFRKEHSLDKMNELKVLTGVKDIKEFSESVQKIIPIFKGEDSDKITKKEEIKIEEKTIIEENEILINQIKVKQQELNQLIDKLCINLSN